MTQPPLTLLVKLTDEQRRQIFEQTGRNLSVLPIASRARSARVQFGGLQLRVTRGVFVPAPVSERLLECALESARNYETPTVAEIGTGCGAIALAIARARPDAMVHATDISQLALRCARRNRSALDLFNVRFHHGSLLEPLSARLRSRVALIVANMPYVPPKHREALGQFLPAGTAIGLGEDGLGLVRQLVAGAREFLIPGGSLVLQLASFQWPGFGDELQALGYSRPQLAPRQSDEPAPLAGSVRWGA